MFSFFRKKPPASTPEASATGPSPSVPVPPERLPLLEAGSSDGASMAMAEAGAARPPAALGHSTEAPRAGWLQRLTQGLRKTGSSIAQVFTGTQIDDALYEELEAALLMADAGVAATEYLLEDLKRRVKAAKATEPPQVKALLVEALVDLLGPLEQTLTLAETPPTVMMVVGVNGAGKTTSIGKLTRHFADAGCTVLLAAGDTFRAAAREQLAAWAERNDQHAAGTAGLAGDAISAASAARIDIVSQAGADPASVSFDAVQAGRARDKDVVIVDTAGRLPTQLHLMEELKKVRRVLGKAQNGAPQEVLLVVDGNTGQNALAQVKAFDEALGLTGLIVTKLDGTAKGGVLAAVALWARQRRDRGGANRPVPVYFIGVGERLLDLQPFRAREFAQALLG